MPGQDAAEALRLVREVHQHVGEIMTRLDATAAYARRTRRMAWLVAAVVALAMLLSGTVAYGVYEFHQGQLRACAIGNDGRSSQLAVWDHVLTLSTPPPHETPAERARRERQIAGLRAFLARHLRQVDCQALYRGIIPR